MNAPEPHPISSDSEQQMRETLALQRDSYIAEGEVSAATRIDRIQRTIEVLVQNAEKISEAMNADFGCRPRQVNLMTDVTGSLENLKHAKKHLHKWMKREKRPSMFPLGLLGGRSSIQYQPKGVVGVIAPWNFPLGMVFEPLAGVLAAGNRAMIKPSEFTPATSKLVEEMMTSTFDPSEISVVTGGAEVGQAFSALPFDHMIFTGATNIARHILTAAARNLVPVTLELGGKSPVVISRSADLEQAMQRVMLGKTLNAGQICLAPDYLLVPEEQLEPVISLATKAVKGMYSSLRDNDQYTSVINERHHKRLSGYLEDAEQRGCRIIPLNPANEDFSNGTGKIPPTLIVSPESDALCMEEEIFGPLLPIRTYKDYDETIDYINANPRPLAAYYFGTDKGEEEAFLHRTTSGGVCINDVIFHIAQEDMPFGGVGPSGMGSYHGIEGFKTFSHAKSIYSQTLKFNVAKLGGMLPPYGKTSEKTIKAQIKS